MVKRCKRIKGDIMKMYIIKPTSSDYTDYSDIIDLLNKKSYKLHILIPDRSDGLYVITSYDTELKELEKLEAYTVNVVECFRYLINATH
ncbi:MAG: hypothetical protein ARM1_0260 [Candidatus Micrarchaeota archaeon]|nr:MAG: hypothetical protein ARM1_0260 [Candidatus Micrarchaeota archaeon]